MTRPSDAAIALKPCPFCGGSATFDPFAEYGPEVSCDRCSADASPDDWNRRAIDAEAKESNLMINSGFQERFNGYQKDERHLTLAETWHWLGQYKLLCKDMLRGSNNGTL